MPKLFQFLHKWLGFLMAPLMVMWFLSGFVMMYHSFPRVERASVLKTLDDLSPSDTLPHPAEALALYRRATSPDATIVSVGMEKRKGEILFFLSGSDGDLLLRSSDGKPYPDTPPSVADLKELSHKITGHTLSEIDTITHLDQWVPFAGRREDLPFYRAKISDEVGTEIYFSGRDGSVLQETDARSRLMSYIGAIPHWLYFRPIREHIDLWIKLFVILGIVGCIMILSGMIIGIYRSRQAKKKGIGKWTPYRDIWYKWHHISGLFFGIVVLTWMFSGWMSLDKLPEWLSGPMPREGFYRLSDPSAISREVALPEKTLTRSLSGIKKLSYRLYFGNLIYSAESVKGTEYFTSERKPLISEADVLLFIKEQLPDTEVTRVELTDQYTDDYLPHPSGKRRPPLPVIRVETGEGTTIYAGVNEPALQISNKATRLNAWAYQRLHSLKFLWSYKHPILWRLIMFFLLTGGTVVSVTGLVLGIRLITRRVRKSPLSR